MAHWIIKQHLEAAHQMVSDLCKGKQKWMMSIPAEPDRDPDLVIGQALRDADTLAELLVESNSLLRSASAIALRKGQDTNWDAFQRQVVDALERQHPIMEGYYTDKAEAVLSSLET